MRWGLGIFIGAVIVAGILEITPVKEAFRSLVEPPWGLESAMFGGFQRDAGIAGSDKPSATALALAIGVAATLFTAIWRPTDLARLARR